MHFFTVACILSSLWIVRFLFQGMRNSLSHVPGPWYSRWTSAVLTYHWLQGRRAIYVQHLHEKYGTAVRVGPNEVDFSSTSGAKQIHTFTRPLPKSSMYDVFMSKKGASSVFGTRDLDVHARYRKLLASAMSEASLKSVESLVHGRATLAVEKIGMEMKEHASADVLKWWLYFSTDVISELSFGNSFTMLEQGKQNEYLSHLQDLARRLGVRVAFPKLVELASYIPLPYFTAAYASAQRMYEYAEESIRRYESMIAAEPHNPKSTLFTKLLGTSADHMSQAEIVANAQSYIVAGSDTTAHSMTYLTWAICRNPTMQARLVEELSGLPDNYVDEDLKQLPYLGQVINETLRLYAAAPAHLPREVVQGGREIDGYWIPVGTIVETQAYSMHRNSAIYQDPERFDPSRWASPSKEMKNAWMPFGGGSRICLGLHLAQMELRVATAGFFRAYPNAKVSTLEDFSDEDMEQVVYFLMYPKNNRCLIQAS